jgi:hypothetical protein
MLPGPEAEVDVQVRDRFVEARYLGTYAFNLYQRQMEVSTRACADARRLLLLVDITDLQAFEPTTLERHKMGCAGAALSRHLEKVAVLGTSTQLGPDGFASMVAQNRGLSVRPFLNREDALQWLLHPEPAAPGN